MNATLEEQIKQHADWFAPEPLHPDLEACLVETDMGTWLKHPLINQPFHSPPLNKQMNLAYASKLERIKELEKKKKFHEIMFWYERPWRLDAFLKYKHRFSDAQYWKQLRDIWIDAESPGVNLKVWIHLFEADRPKKHLLMDANERRYLSKQPDTLTVYRGSLPLYRQGLSWTVQIFPTALFFAKRFGQTGHVYEAKVEKRNVYAYLSGRNEGEILVNPKHLIDLKKWNNEKEVLETSA